MSSWHSWFFGFLMVAAPIRMTYREACRQAIRDGHAGGLLLSANENALQEPQKL